MYSFLSSQEIKHFIFGVFEIKHIVKFSSDSGCAGLPPPSPAIITLKLCIMVTNFVNKNVVGFSF